MSSLEEELEDIEDQIDTRKYTNRIKNVQARRKSRLSKMDINQINDILTPDIDKKYDSNSFKELTP